MQSSQRPGVPLLAGEQGLHPAGAAFPRPGLASGPASGLSTVLLILQNESRVTWEGKPLSNSLCFCFHLKRLVTLLHVERTKATIQKRLSMFWS